MPEPYFERLRTKLVERGVSARYVQRLVRELEDHYEDAAGERPELIEPPFRAAWASERLGEDVVIVAHVLARPELRGRLYGLRAAMRPLCLSIARAQLFGADSALAGPALARWGASITCGAVVTAGILLVMAHSIALDI